MDEVSSAHYPRVQAAVPPPKLRCERTPLERRFHVAHALRVLRMELGHGDESRVPGLEEAGAGVVLEDRVVPEDVKHGRQA